jgi:hypothetical protein
MPAQDIAKLIANAVVAVAVVCLVIFAGMPWLAGAGMIATLLVPSAAPALLGSLKDWADGAKPPKGPSMLGGVVLLVVAGVLGCSQPAAPIGVYVEAGTTAVNDACDLIEGVTQNQTVISACATAEEIAFIATTVGQFLRKGSESDAGCTVLPKSAFCATRAEIGRGIELVLERRRARLTLDAAGSK